MARIVITSHEPHGLKPRRLVAVLYFNSCLPTGTDTLRFHRTLHHLATRQGIGRHDNPPVQPHRGTKYLRDWNVVPMDAVLPWQSVLLSTCYQEPNCSFGGHALTVSLWKPYGLDLTELCSNCYYGCPREDILLTRVSSGSKKSLSLYRKLVNMLPYEHGKDTNNDPLRRTRQTSDCRAASILWAAIRQRCNPTRVTRNGADHHAGKG